MYATRNYHPLVLYLKGFNLTIEIWRGNRNTKGWKLKETDDSSLVSIHSLINLDVACLASSVADMSLTGCPDRQMSADLRRLPKSGDTYPQYHDESHVSGKSRVGMGHEPWTERGTF